MQFRTLLNRVMPKKRDQHRPRHGQMVIDVTHQGNRVELTADNFLVNIEVAGVDLPPELDASFAVWLLLPIAMSRGSDLRISRPLDPEVIANAEKLAQVWEMWAPNRFSSIRVFGAGTWQQHPVTNSRGPVALYSGGVDSTYALLRNASSLGHVLTIRGQDYKVDEVTDRSHFERLLAQTNPLLEHLGLRRVIVTSTLRQHMRAGRLTHGFFLAGYAFLLRSHFSEGLIAADFTPEQDMICAPWGTNHVTNQYFAGSDFSMRTVCNDAMRSEKIALIADNEAALWATSFCQDRDLRPQRCGKCRKCTLTKAMLMASLGSFPNIFLDMTLTEKHMASLDLSKRQVRAALADLYSCAKRNERLEQIPGLTDLHANLAGMMAI